MTSVNILPGSLNVTGNISATQASVGGNLVVGSNIYVSGNLYSANVTVSGGGGGGGGGSGVSSIVAGNGITTSTSTGNVTVNALVAGICGGAGIDVVSNSGVWTLCADVASINAGQGIFVDNTNRAVTIRNTGVFGPINITNDSGTGNLIGGVSLSDGKIGATNIVNQILCGNSDNTGIYSVGNATRGTVSLRTKVVNIMADPNVTVRNLDGTFYIGATGGGGGGGVADASEWSTYPATRDVSMNGWSLENVYNIIGSGEAYELQGDMDKPSYIGNLTIDSAEPSVLTLHSYDDSRVVISGDSNGREGVSINPAGSISNNSNTSNTIGRVTMHLCNDTRNNIEASVLRIDSLPGAGKQAKLTRSAKENVVNPGIVDEYNLPDRKWIITYCASEDTFGVGSCNAFSTVLYNTVCEIPVWRTWFTRNDAVAWTGDPNANAGDFSVDRSLYVKSNITSDGVKLLRLPDTGGKVNVFGGSTYNEAGPKGFIETNPSGNTVNIGHYALDQTANDTLQIYCGNAPRIVVKNDSVRFNTVVESRHFKTYGADYIDLSYGNTVSRIGNFRFNSTDTNGAIGKLYPTSNGLIQITGDEGGNNPASIDRTGAISNGGSTSNNIGGVVLSNGVINSKTIATFSQDGSGRSSWLTDIAGIYDLVWFQIAGDRNWRYIRAFIPTNSFTRNDGNIIPLVSSGEAFNVQNYSTTNGAGLYKRGYQWDGTVGGNIVRLYITRINQLDD